MMATAIKTSQTKGLLSKTIMVLHMHFESLYISLPSSAEQQREMAKLYLRILGNVDRNHYFFFMSSFLTVRCFYIFMQP